MSPFGGVPLPRDLPLHPDSFSRCMSKELMDTYERAKLVCPIQPGNATDRLLASTRIACSEQRRFVATQNSAEFVISKIGQFTRSTLPSQGGVKPGMRDQPPIYFRGCAKSLARHGGQNRSDRSHLVVSESRAVRKPSGRQVCQIVIADKVEAPRILQRIPQPFGGSHRNRRRVAEIVPEIAQKYDSIISSGETRDKGFCANEPIVDVGDN